MSDLERARSILAMMLDFGFDGAADYRRQAAVAELVRHPTGCSIDVDRSRSVHAPYDERIPAARLPVAALGPGKLVVWLHSSEGYLDDLDCSTPIGSPTQRPFTSTAHSVVVASACFRRLPVM